MTIWEVGNGTNKSLAIINRDDPRLEDMRLALSTWEVKRTLLNNKKLMLSINWTLLTMTIH